MIDKFIRFCGWLNLIVYSIMSMTSIVLVVINKFDLISILVLSLFIFIPITGWNTRRYGLSDYKLTQFSKTFAFLTLIVGIIFTVLVPIAFIKIKRDDRSLIAMINLLIIFVPVIISSIVVLKSKTIK